MGLFHLWNVIIYKASYAINRIGYNNPETIVLLSVLGVYRWQSFRAEGVANDKRINKTRL